MAKYIAHLCALLPLTINLIACGGVSERRPITTARINPVIEPAAPTAEQEAIMVQRAQDFERNGKFLDAALTYSRLAGNTNPPKKQHYQLLAVAALLRGNYVSQANQLLDETHILGLEINYFDRKQALIADMELHKQKPKQVLTLLRNMPQPQMANALKIKIYTLQADALQMMGKLTKSIHMRLRLEAVLTNPDSIRNNQITILDTLAGLSRSKLQQLMVRPPPDRLSGWIELTQIIKSNQQSPLQLQQKLQQWRLRYPQHSALNDVVVKMIEQKKALILVPRQIAILLPLQGKFTTHAQAIRDGFLAAYFSSMGNIDRPIIKIYDTSNTVGSDASSIMEVYSHAVQDGANIIVGPLTKTSVTILANREQLEIPTLALNYTDFEGDLPNNFFQFGLSPEDEAQQVAERAWLDGHRRTVVLIPDDQWGERILFAFKERWEQIGGLVAEYQTYPAKENDYSASIRRVFNIDDSELRLSALRSIVRLSPSFTPRRRQDVDFVFIAAFPRQARLIRPQLRFHHAADLPVYATSHIYTGKVAAQIDRDMDGIWFGDMPWVLPGSSKHNAVKKDIMRLWPESSARYMRLYALGIDAFHLLPTLNKLKAYSTEYFQGVTGNLHIANHNRIQRRLTWAGFKRGIPRLLNQQK